MGRRIKMIAGAAVLAGGLVGIWLSFRRVGAASDRIQQRAACVVALEKQEQSPNCAELNKDELAQAKLEAMCLKARRLADEAGTNPDDACRLQVGVDSHSSSAGQTVRMPEWVSGVRLLATPEKYEQKVIGVHGVVNIEFEGNAVYLSEEDLRHHNVTNAFWLDLSYPSTEVQAERKAQDEMTSGDWCLVVGRFHGSQHGHLGLFAGTIEVMEIRGCEPITGPASVDSAAKARKQR
jgi:hypothetical protein